MPSEELMRSELSYSAPLISNIRQILTGLQGFVSMAREIIQNADDAGANIVQFNIRDDALIIKNDAEFLNCGLSSDECPWAITGDLQLGKRKACDFHAISKVGSGNKYNQPGLIGRFGIGFVSVYQLTDQPIIRSGEVELMLNPLLEKNQIRKVDNADGTEIQINWALDDRSPIRDALNASAFSLNNLESLQADLVTTAEDCLLFLKNLKSIEILRNGKRVSFVNKTIDDEKNLDLFLERKNKLEKWYVVHLDAKDEASSLKEKFAAIEKLDRQSAMQIAFRLDGKSEAPGRLFAYLPTEQSSPLPCHINADFFPEQTRKSLVLSGEQHERYWNEMLLNFAAQEIATRLEDLRDILGFAGLWALISEAYKNRNHVNFGIFWKEISNALSNVEIYWTSSEKWSYQADCMLLDSKYSVEHEESLDDIGITTVHTLMRPFKSAMVAAGLRALTLEDLVNALKDWDILQINKKVEHDWASVKKTILPIWRLLDDFLANEETNKTEKNPNKISNQDKHFQFQIKNQIKKLSEIRFALRSDGQVSSLSSLHRLPPSVNIKRFSNHFNEIPLISDQFKQFRHLFELIPEFDFGDVLNELSEQVQCEDTAKLFLSQDKNRIIDFYDLLAEYPRKNEWDYAIDLSLTPFLIGHDCYLTPENAVLPGGFDDPVGRFNTLDLSFFNEKSQSFLKEILKVRILTLEAYIKDHLPEILNDDLTDIQYLALLDVLLLNQKILDKKDIKDTLILLPLVRTINGELLPPSKSYNKTKFISDILGKDCELWLDETVFPEQRLDMYLALFRSLGMGVKPSLVHVMNRIDEIVQHPPSLQAQSSISKIFKYLVDFYKDENLAKNKDLFDEEIERMQETEWLPAKVLGKHDLELWYAPYELFQPFRSSGFSTQTNVLAVPEIRSNQYKEFLNFLKMPAEPDTSVIIEHLETCITRNLEPDQLTYVILNERFQGGDRELIIERLRHEKCIFSPNKKEFLRTDRVFWNRHASFGKYCFAAPNWLKKYNELFGKLGVEEDPPTITYVEVLIEIANEYGNTPKLPGDILLVHNFCMSQLSQKLFEDPSNTSPLLPSLREHPFLLTLSGTLAFIGEIAINDSDWLAQPFGEELVARLVESKPETTEVIDWFQIPSLSSVTRIETVTLGDVIVDEDATNLVHDRSDLLAWLCVDLKKEARSRFEKTLSEIKLVRTDALTVRSVFQLEDIPFASPPRKEEVAFDTKLGTVYVHVDLPGNYWIYVFRALFSTLLAGEGKVDIRALSLAANTVLQAKTQCDAASELRQAGYDAPKIEDNQEIEPINEEVGELNFKADDEQDNSFHEVENEEVIDNETGSTNKKASDSHIAEENMKNVVSAGSKGTNEIAPEVKKKSFENSSNETTTSSSKDGLANTDVNKPSRNARTEWMRSYVKLDNEEKRNGGKSSGASPERISAIDEGAMAAVMSFELARDFAPERQPHFNPGFDILSRSKNNNEKRLIEVKGLDGEWTERGVKLSRTQMLFARDNPEEAWLYVVEHALDPKIRKVSAIKNPFFKADEFWFDRVWRDVADEESVDYKDQFITGRRIEVEGFGEGTILEIKKIGIMSQLQIKFKDWGTRSISFNATTMKLLED